MNSTDSRAVLRLKEILNKNGESYEKLTKIIEENMKIGNSFSSEVEFTPLSFFKNTSDIIFKGKIIGSIKKKLFSKQILKINNNTYTIKRGLFSYNTSATNKLGKTICQIDQTWFNKQIKFPKITYQTKEYNVPEMPLILNKIIQEFNSMFFKDFSKLVPIEAYYRIAPFYNKDRVAIFSYKYKVLRFNSQLIDIEEAIIIKAVLDYYFNLPYSGFVEYPGTT